VAELLLGGTGSPFAPLPAPTPNILNLGTTRPPPLPLPLLPFMATADLARRTLAALFETDVLAAAVESGFCKFSKRRHKLTNAGDT
jgi:hypothetical protein